MDDRPQILRPRPLRAFDSVLASSSADLSPPTLTEAMTSPKNSRISNQNSSDLRDRPGSSAINYCNSSNIGRSISDDSTNLRTPPRSQSVLNLTVSALAGIFQPSSSTALSKYDSSAMRESLSTTSGTVRAQTPYGNGENADGRTDSKSRNSIGNRDEASRTAEINTSYNDSLARKKSLKCTEVKSVWQPRANQHTNFANISRVLARLGLLFVLGIAYGLMISRLHDGGRVAPVQVQGVDRGGWLYLSLWGCAGIVLGVMMPWLDASWSRRGTTKKYKWSANLGEKWYAVVRNVGAFVGVAFAIRKLPWQSTLQLSVTLALANPALWYLLDRSYPGIILSTLTSLIGTVTILKIHPEMSPITLSDFSSVRWDTIANPSYSASDEAQVQVQNQEQSKSVWDAASTHYIAGSVLYEQIGVVTWIASVLFCSCVCLGNIGRRLFTEPQNYIIN